MTKKELKKQLLSILDMWENGEVLECASALKRLADKIKKEAEKEND